jgi:hypothetical protein
VLPLPVTAVLGIVVALAAVKLTATPAHPEASESAAPAATDQVLHTGA